MRLICPNCGAQYEIDKGLIPDEGRDVQCSDCGHTWFETPGASLRRETQAPDLRDEDDDITAEPAQPAPAEPRPAAQPPAPQAPEDDDIQAKLNALRDAEDSADAPPAAEPERHADADRAAAWAAAAATAAAGTAAVGAHASASTPDLADTDSGTPPSSLTPDVAQILREEAEHDRQMRQREADPFESQPDLGLDEPASGPGSRKDQLPDIEEINSSLRSEDIEDAEISKDRRGKGFWRAFFFVILLALIAVAVYIFADDIAAKFPAVAEYLGRYVEWVDGVRLWLNDILQKVQNPPS